MKKRISALLCLAALLFGGCSYDRDKIALFCREEGSGTREMFVSGLNILKDGIDNVADAANITSSGAVMLSAVAGNKNAIGFISAAATNDKVKTLAIDGKLPQDELYPLSRDFIVAYNNEKLNDLAKDFLTFLSSKKAADIVRQMGYYDMDASSQYVASPLSGKIVIAGSASVFPLMDRLREEYELLQPDVEIEIQQNDSSTGISLLSQDMTDFAMSSRNIKEGELEGDYGSMVLAGDAIAVIVHPDNAYDDISSQHLRSIFDGSIVRWEELS